MASKPKMMKTNKSAKSGTVHVASSRYAIPSASTRRWVAGFPGEFAGNIFTAKSIDLGRSITKVAIADSMSAVANSATLATLTAPVAFLRTAADGTDRYWANGGKLFKTPGTDPKATWSADAIASTPTAPLYDLIEFVSDLYVPIDTDVSQMHAGTWTGAWWSTRSGASALTTGVPHRFFILEGALCITNGRYVATWDGTIATQQALILPSQFQAQFGVATGDFVYIGTKSLNAGNAEVFSWDRSNTNYTARYDIGDSECLAGFLVDAIPYIITKKGQIKRFSGQGFKMVQQFPSAEIPKNINNIDPNGISVDGSTVKIMVDFGVIADTRLRSGLWTFEADTLNLYHSGSVRNGNGKDYSQQELAKVGAVRMTNPGNGRYLIGAQSYNTYSSSSVHGIYALDESATSGRGYFMTPKMKAPNARRFWRQWHARFPIFLSSSDRLRMAYRIKESTTLPAYETITWASSTTFTGSNASAAIGDFVEIIAGDNAGAIAKITGKSGAGPFTFTIDLTLNTSAVAARACYHRFIDLGTESTQTAQEHIFRTLARSNWIQLLIELRGGPNSPQLEEIIADGSDVAL